MLKSMTGYGRREAVTEGKKILVEIKSVNHRYSDYNIKVQRHLGFLEDKIRKYVSSSITRGKVDIYLNVENYETADKQITLNKEIAKNYIDVLYQLRDEFGLKDDITVSNVASNPDIFSTERVEEDEEALWNTVKTVLDGALSDFIAMREREGERIQKDLCERIDYMRTLVKEVDERSPQTVKEYSDKLYEKIKEVLDGKEIDEARILTEVAIYADKVAVNEETVRLGSHFEEFDTIINSGSPAGRKLDFLVQEINREANTIGSKAQDAEITRAVVDMKSEIEKIREQIRQRKAPNALQHAAGGPVLFHDRPRAIECIYYIHPDCEIARDTQKNRTCVRRFLHQASMDNQRLKRCGSQPTHRLSYRPMCAKELYCKVKKRRSHNRKSSARHILPCALLFVHISFINPCYNYDIIQYRKRTPHWAPAAIIPS